MRVGHVCAGLSDYSKEIRPGGGGGGGGGACGHHEGSAAEATKDTYTESSRVATKK